MGIPYLRETVWEVDQLADELAVRTVEKMPHDKANCRDLFHHCTSR
jgi:hypothetical protein